MTTNPDQIRAEIEDTRGDLSANVNALADSVRPGNVARRQADKVRGSLSDIKDHVMGSSDDDPAGASGPSGAASAVSGAASSVGDAVSSAGDAASSVGPMARRQTRGNPMAAGLIALGAGWLLGSLLPATAAEQQAAAALKEKAEPLTDQVTQVAKDAADNLKDSAKEAVDQVKSTASDATAAVKEEAQSGAADVSSSAKDAKETVQQHNGQSSSV